MFQQDKQFVELHIKMALLHVAKARNDRGKNMGGISSNISSKNHLIFILLKLFQYFT